MTENLHERSYLSTMSAIEAVNIFDEHKYVSIPPLHKTAILPQH